MMSKRVFAGVALGVLVLSGFYAAHEPARIAGVDFGAGVAYADSTPFASYELGSTQKLAIARYLRPQFFVLDSDTAGKHHKVPGMSDGDKVLSLWYVPWDSLSAQWNGARYPQNLTDSILVYKDSFLVIRPRSTAIDSGYFYGIFHDATD